MSAVSLQEIPKPANLPITSVDVAWQRFQEIENRWVGISDEFRLVSEERRQAYLDYESAKQKAAVLLRPVIRSTPPQSA